MTRQGSWPVLIFSLLSIQRRSSVGPYSGQLADGHPPPRLTSCGRTKRGDSYQALSDADAWFVAGRNGRGPSQSSGAGTTDRASPSLSVQSVVRPR